MKLAIPQINRYKLAESIGLFMADKPLSIQKYGVWQGYMTKAEQIAAFGFYMGKGLIEVHNNHCSITMRRYLAFGGEMEVVHSISALTGWADFDECGKPPIAELNLYCSLNQFSEVAA